MKLLSLFSGIGSCEKALNNLGIDFELVNYCEINKSASKCYSIIHNVPETLNLWDVRKIDVTKIADFDLLMHGSPCQDFSSQGKELGGEKGSITRSSLLWDSVNIIKEKKPKYVIWENVRNVLYGKHNKVFNDYLNELSMMGYTNYMPDKGFLNSKDFGIPQSRERVFVVSIIGEHEPYVFPTGIELKTCLRDFIDVTDKDDITNTVYNRYAQKYNKSEKDFIDYMNELPITKGIGYKKMTLYSYTSEDKCYIPSMLIGPLRTTPRHMMWHNNKIYNINARMKWRLMGFTDVDFNKVENVVSTTALKCMAGNSIVVNVLEAIFAQLFKKEA